MITQQAQIKLNLPLALKGYLESKANKYDIPVSAYLKHLILKDVADIDYPTFQISDASEKKARKAILDRSKAINISNISQYFSNE